jgi:hypothetical protein
MRLQHDLPVRRRGIERLVRSLRNPVTLTGGALLGLAGFAPPALGATTTSPRSYRPVMTGLGRQTAPPPASLLPPPSLTNTTN